MMASALGIFYVLPMALVQLPLPVEGVGPFTREG